MTQRALFHMDPLESLHVQTDSTYLLIQEAQRRGYELWHILPGDLAWTEGQLTAPARAFVLEPGATPFYRILKCSNIDLSRASVLFMRQDPPFDMAYITATHLLERIDTLVINNPGAVRNAPEKLWILDFPDLIPPTLIARNLDPILAFRQRHGDIIVKPLFGNGGFGVFRLPEGDQNLQALLELFHSHNNEPLMVQPYLANVRNGDKRILLVDGKPVGAINRIPQAESVRANLHAGGQAQPAELTARDQEICQRLEPTLKAQNLLFVGIDVIDGYLIEINVTSPTGLQEANAFLQTRLEARIWDAVERKIAK